MADEEYVYPASLIKYLKEQESEGYDITLTHTMDGSMWIIQPTILGEWLTLVEWYEGQDTFDVVNLCGRAFGRVFKMMKEIKDI